MKIATIVGARPQFIKASPISRAIDRSNVRTGSGDGSIEEILIHTGQHYDYGMSDSFFRDLGLKEPKHNIRVGSGSHGEQLAKMLERLERALSVEGPDLVLVYGDTNSTLAGAIVADRLHIPVAHIEAGLRSFNRRMPEESNRVITDHLSSLLFAPTQTAVDNLLHEGITAGVHLVGDVMYEAAIDNGLIAEEKSDVLHRLKIMPKKFALATIHRAENTDDVLRLSHIVEALLEISEIECIVWPMHPRTRRCISSERFQDFARGSVKVIDPAPYLDMLLLEKSANVILTDSGGVQKEAMWFRVPCVTLRDETEWVETVKSGWNRIAGSQKETIVSLFHDALQGPPGNPQSQIVGEVTSELIVEELRNFVFRVRPSIPFKCEFSF